MNDSPKAARRKCFVVAPIGADGSPERKHSDSVLKHIVKKALEPGYEVERADDINRSGMIIAQIVQQVFEADLVVADLSFRNANVFYELAIRHAAKKPTVHLAVAGDDPPFDVNQIRLIKFNLEDLDSIDDAQQRLKEQVKAIEDGRQATTPVQFAEVLNSLESGDTKEGMLIEVYRVLSEGIESLQGQVSQILRIVGNVPFGLPTQPLGVANMGKYNSLTLGAGLNLATTNWVVGDDGVVRLNVAPLVSAQKISSASIVGAHEASLDTSGENKK